MKYTRLQERYPVFTLEVEKQKTVFSTTDEIIAYLKQCVDGHGVSRFIAVFDHFSHTNGLKNGWIDESILDAKNDIVDKSDAIDLSGRKRKPDRWQPDWIRKKYFDE